MAQLRYSVIVDTLTSFRLDIWEQPYEVLELIKNAGYDGIDLTAEPDRIEIGRYREIAEIARSMGSGDCGTAWSMGDVACGRGAGSGVHRRCGSALCDWLRAKVH